MQVIKKDGKVYCTTTIHYPPEVVKGMKKAGYRVTEKEEKDETKGNS